MVLSCSKKLSVLLRNINSKNCVNFYFLSCFHYFATEKNLNYIKSYVKIKVFTFQ